MNARQTSISFHSNFTEATLASKYNQVHNAVGYLVTWAINGESGRYSGLMTLYGDDVGNLHAAYRDKTGIVTYTMFGKRGSNGDYSFHS